MKFSRLYEELKFDNLQFDLDDLKKQFKSATEARAISREIPLDKASEGWPESNFLKFATNADGISSNMSRNSRSDVSSKPSRCYYNALDYINRYEDDGVELAYGYVSELPNITSAARRYEEYAQKRSNGEDTHFPYMDFTPHTFLIDTEGKIIDPTFSQVSDSMYFYKTVPKEIWKKFNYKPDDPTFDAKDFGDYVRANL